MVALVKPTVVGVIPAYNSAGFIEKSLNSLLMQDYPFSRRIVIDDHSLDNTYEFIASKYADKVELIRNEQNYGFAYGLNLALSMAKDADFLFVLEDDIELADKDYVTRAVAYFKDSHLAIVCGQAIGFDRQRLSLTKRCFSRYVNADYQETGIKKVSYSLLKSDLMRISALNKVSGFGFTGNPKLGLEDQVLAKKLKASGYYLLKDASLRYYYDVARTNTLGGIFKSESNAGLTLGIAISDGVISLNHQGTENQSRFIQRTRQATFFTLFLFSFLLFFQSPLAVGITILALLVLEYLIYIGKSASFNIWEKLYFALIGLVDDFNFGIYFYYGFISGIIKRLRR